MTKLTLNQANKIIEAAIADARKKNYQPMAIVVLDEAGNLKAAQREDDASMFRIDIATGKAWAAVGMGIASRALAERAADNPNFFTTLAATANGQYLPLPGAVLITDRIGTATGKARAAVGMGIASRARA